MSSQPWQLYQGDLMNRNGTGIYLYTEEPWMKDHPKIVWNDIVCNKDKFISQVHLQGNPKLNAIIKLLKEEK